MTTKEIIEQMEKELFGYNDRGIVSYSDGLAISGYMTPHAICNNCGFSAKGEEAKEMMFGHKGCPKPNGKFIRNDVTVEKLEKSIRTLLESFGEEIMSASIGAIPTSDDYAKGWNDSRQENYKVKSLKVKEIISSLDK